MSTQQITPEAVWNVINADPAFLESPESICEAMRPYIEALPVILSEKLQEKATLDTLKSAKLIFLQYCLANGFIQAMVDATPESFFGLMTRETMPQVMQEALRRAVVSLENGTSSMLLRLSSYMNQEAMRLYEAGELTIGDLLIVHPMYMVANAE